MSFAASRRSIESHFNTQWGGATPVRYERVQFSEEGLDEFVSLEIEPISRERRSQGSAPHYEETGQILVDIYILPGRGPGRADALATAVLTALTNQALPDGVNTHGGTIVETEFDEGRHRFRARVAITYTYHADGP